MDDKLCPNCDEPNPSRAKFCMECGERFTGSAALLDARTDVQGERRVVTVLFADLSGFTAYSESTDVEDVHALAEETANKLGDIVVRYGGYVDKIIGDCVMAVFGAPTSNEDDAERGVRAALDMHAYVAEHTDRFARLELTIGLNTGEVIWAPVGPGGRHTVLGDTVNTAARLQSAAQRGQVLIGAPTADGIGDTIDLESVEPIKAKNKEEPVDAFLATGVKGVVAITRSARTRLWGRDAELERLRELWETCCEEKRPYLATLSGDTGTGKTRLIEEFIADADVGVLYGRCLPYGEGITYWPVIEIIQAAAGIHHDDDQPTISTKLGDLLEGLGSDDLDELRTMAVSLAHLIGAPTTPRGTYTATEISRGELHWGLRRIVELAAQNNPIVLVLEDLHNAETTLLELIAFFLESTATAPIMLIGAGRPEFLSAEQDVIGTRPNHRVIELGSLSGDLSRDMVGELLASRDVPADVVDQLVRTAGGNPLFIEEMARIWSDAAAAGDDASSFEVPSSLLGVITARLDRLPAEEVRVLSRAAVVGNVFWGGSVTAMLGEAGSDALDMLQVRDMIRERADSAIGDEREFEFKHGLIRDVAYGRLTKAERVALHARCADWITSMSANTDEMTEVIAYHLEQACLLAKDVARSEAPPRVRAVGALRRAGEKAESHEGVREASRYYERALVIVGDGLPEAAADLRVRHARMSGMLGELENALIELADAASSARDVGRDDLACRALTNLADIALTSGDVDGARSHLATAREIASALDDRTHLVRVGFVDAVIASAVDGDVDGAIATLRDALEIADEIGDPGLRLAGHLRLGTELYNGGDLDGAQREFELTSKIAAEQGSLQQQAVASRVLAAIGYQRGPREEAELLCTQVLAWLERIGDRFMSSEVMQLLGQFALARGDATAAVAHLRDALKLAGGSLGTEGEINRYLAEASWMLERPGQARQAAADARDAVMDEDDQTVAMARVAEAFASAASGDNDAARAAMDEAIALLTDAGMETDTVDVLVSYARLLTSIGARDDALGRYRAARDAATAIGATAAAGAIDSAIDDLSA